MYYFVVHQINLLTIAELFNLLLHPHVWNIGANNRPVDPNFYRAFFNPAHPPTHKTAVSLSSVALFLLQKPCPILRINAMIVLNDPNLVPGIHQYLHNVNSVLYRFRPVYNSIGLAFE